MSDVQPGMFALGARLRAVREKAGLSGIQLATALGTGWRQPKISKVETGRQLPTVAELRNWAAATGVEADPLIALRAKASAEYTANKDRLADAGGAVARQEEIGALERSCTFLAEYQPSMINGRLQTPTYMREMVIGDEFLAADGIPNDQIGHVIAARVRRQGILYEPGRQIVHVVGEAALRTLIGGMSADTLRRQLTHLAELAELPGHTFGVVPFHTRVPLIPLSGWAMYDLDLVEVESIGGSFKITDPSVVARYSHWLERLLEVALTDAEAAAFCRRVATELPDE